MCEERSPLNRGGMPAHSRNRNRLLQAPGRLRLRASGKTRKGPERSVAYAAGFSGPTSNANSSRLGLRPVARSVRWTSRSSNPSLSLADLSPFLRRSQWIGKGGPPQARVWLIATPSSSGFARGSRYLFIRAIRVIRGFHFGFRVKPSVRCRVAFSVEGHVTLPP